MQRFDLIGLAVVHDQLLVRIALEVVYRMETYTPCSEVSNENLEFLKEKKKVTSS